MPARPHHAHPSAPAARHRHLAPGVLVALVALLGSFVVVTAAPSSASTTAHVLHVGSWQGHPGEYATIQAAAAAAQPGDWILVGPGDYHERMDYAAPTGEASGGVMLTTPGVHLRGMDRNAVVIDGTKPGAPACSTAPGDQDMGPSGQGRNGAESFKVDGVTMDNFTVCNFLTGSGGGGNEIWFNGGDGSGTQNMGAYSGTYLSATSTFYSDPNRGEYGIFVSNVTGPGTLTHTYGSNMADGAYYIGACPDCNTVVDDAHAQYSALGYSGTNSGGRLLIQHSEFDHNKTGFSTNSQNNDDAPSPQDGACPAGLTGPTGTTSCWVFRDNWVHDNNDTTAPGTGTAELGPVGTGLVISGGRNDTVVDNRFENNGSWAMLVVPYVDTGTPPPIAHCDGGISNWLGAGWCFYGAWGNEIANNSFSGNGSFGNYSNGDLADLSNPDPFHAGNCWHGNTDPGGVSSAPADLQATNAQCGVKNQGGEAIKVANLNNPSSLLGQVSCATGVFGPCGTLPSPPNPPNTPIGNYPTPQTPVMQPLLSQPTMPDPCAGVPGDAWCPPAAALTVSPTTATPGSTVAVASTGWQAGSTVTVTIAGVAAGTLTADEHGTVNGNVTVPSSITATSATLALTGVGWAGSPLTQSATLALTQPGGSTTTTTPSSAPAAIPVTVTPVFTG